MPMDPEIIWKTEFAKIPLDPTGLLGPTLLATFVTLRVTGKLGTDPTAATLAPPAFYTWVQAPFEAALRQIALTPSPEPVSSATLQAQAWASATSASQFIITPLTTFNPPPPPTNGIASVAVALPDPSSIAQGVKGIIEDLVAAPPAANPLDVVWPVAIRKAFAGLRFIINGVDTTVPTPLPIVLTSPVM